MLHRKGFSEDHIRLFVDDDSKYKRPTARRIKEALIWLVTDRQAGDIVFLHFSGHGTQVPAAPDDSTELDGLDEAIVLADIYLLSDNELKSFVNALPEGVSTTVVMDCCHSGTMLDGELAVIDGDKEGGDDEEKDEDEEPSEARDALLVELTDGDAVQNAENRSLPLETVCEIFGDKTGADVPPTLDGINEAMKQIFGSPFGKFILKFALAALEKQDPTGLGGAVGMATGVLGGLAAGDINQGSGGTTGTSSGNASEPQFGAEQQDAAAHALFDMFTQFASMFVGKKATPEAPPMHRGFTKADAVALVASCQAHETSADVRPKNGHAFGALTKAVTDIEKDEPEISFYDLVTKVRAVFAKAGYKQNPSLETSEEKAKQIFICEA